MSVHQLRIDQTDVAERNAEAESIAQLMSEATKQRSKYCIQGSYLKSRRPHQLEATASLHRHWKGALIMKSELLAPSDASKMAAIFGAGPAIDFERDAGRAPRGFCIVLNYV
nr:hypothetical protein [Tanacetum cinerariifolium]